MLRCALAFSKSVEINHFSIDELRNPDWCLDFNSTRFHRNWSDWSEDESSLVFFVLSNNQVWCWDWSICKFSNYNGEWIFLNDEAWWTIWELWKLISLFVKDLVNLNCDIVSVLDHPLICYSGKSQREIILREVNKLFIKLISLIKVAAGDNNPFFKRCLIIKIALEEITCDISLCINEHSCGFQATLSNINLLWEGILDKAFTIRGNWHQWLEGDGQVGLLTYHWVR